jgi:hypothetical protein
LRDGDDVGAALDDGRAALTNWAAFRADDDRSGPRALLGNENEQGHEGMEHGSDHEGMDHGSGHEGMDHGGEVAGLPMAMTEPDRDGLQLDVLKISLGPVLAGWPTGLVLRAELQGDILAGADLSWIETSAVFYEPDTSLGLARMAAMRGGRAARSTAAKASGVRDMRRVTSAWNAARVEVLPAAGPVLRQCVMLRDLECASTSRNAFGPSADGAPLANCRPREGWRSPSRRRGKG